MCVQPRPGDGLTADDRQRLAALVHDLGPRLRAYVRRVYGNIDADEVVAEAFCRAVQNVQSLWASSRPDLYVLTIARNLCRDTYRRARPTRGVVLLAERDGGAAPPDEQVGRGEQLGLLRAAVAELPENLREVVVLRLSGGLKFEEIAALLGMPLGTALSRMHQAVETLRSRLGTVHER